MFISKTAKEKYFKLMDAIKHAPIIPPCMDTDPELWFAEKVFTDTQFNMTTQAKRFCERCPVRQLCLDYAIENREEFGIWGGSGQRERDKIRQKREKTPNRS